MTKLHLTPLFLALLSSVALAKGAQPMSAQTNTTIAPAAAAAPAMPTNLNVPGMMDAATTEALHKTQQGLIDPAARAKMMEGDAKAQAQDAKVRAVLGDHSEGAYQLSAQLLETLVQKTNGDPQKMQELVNQLMANPQMLEQYLTGQQREQIRKMASEIEGKKGSTPVSGSR
jgi:hypothetical protein